MTDEIRRGPTAIEIRPVVDPIGRPAVLIQLEDGFVIAQPADALRIAAMIEGVVAEIAATSS